MVKKEIIKANLQGFQIKSPQPKIFQYKGVRHAIRLEPVFLRALQNLARSYGMRVNQLIAYLKEEHDGPNFSSFLRSLCMAEAEQKLSSTDAMSHFENIQFFMDNCPIPGLILTEEQTIVFANQSFFSWIDTPQLKVREKKLYDLFDIRENQSIREILNRLMFGVQKEASVGLIYRTRDSSLTATASFIPYTSNHSERFSFIVWIKTAPTKRPARIFKPSQSSR